MGIDGEEVNAMDMEKNLEQCRTCKYAHWGVGLEEHGDMELTVGGQKRMVCTEHNLKLTFGEHGMTCSKYEEI